MYRSGSERIRALQNVDFAVGEGEFSCILGASGSGKSTLLMVLAGIVSPDSGEVEVLGQRIDRASEASRADFRLNNIGIVFQSNNLLPEFSAEENVALPLLARRLPSKEVQQAIQCALEEVGLEGIGARMPPEMSGGQRQRVGIARALAGGQKVILADEPTGALDTENSRRLFALLARMCAVGRISVVLATHDPLAREFAHSTSTMTDGVLTR